MAKEIKEHNAPESAKRWNIWNNLARLYRFSPLGNEIGVVGDEEEPDASKKDTEGDDWEVSPIGEEKEEVSEKKSPDDKKSADDTPKEKEEEVEDKKKEGEEEIKKEEKKAKEEEKKAKEKTKTKEAEEDEPTEREAQLTAELEQVRKQADFYSTKYNELLGEPEEEVEDKTKVQAKEESIPDKEVSKDVVKPGDWETQEQTAAYFENRVAGEVAKATKAVEVQLEGVRKELNITREHLIKFIHPDYDEIAKRAWDDVFEMDGKGKIVSVKNEATLRWFKESPFPQLAVYEYGLSKQAPKKIKDGIKKQTEKTLEKIEKKPKGPTQPDTDDTTVEVTPLDWDTPQAEADKQLKKDGLI